MNTLSQEVMNYCSNMNQVKARLAFIECSLNNYSPCSGIDSSSEILAIQFRKTLELIAFGSLLANRVKYSAAYADYASHWSAKLLLNNLKTINPDFYPKPLKPFIVQPNGIKHFPVVTNGFLTPDQFTRLYTDCNAILHSSNPFKLKKAKLISQQSARTWVRLIKRLLNIHLARFVDQSNGWLVQMNFGSENSVHAAIFTLDSSVP